MAVSHADGDDAEAHRILEAVDGGLAALRRFIDGALDHPWMTELGVFDTTRIKPTELVAEFGRDSGERLYEIALACFDESCLIFDKKTDKRVWRLAEALMALPHGRTTALKRLLSHTGYRRLKPKEAHFTIERDALAAAELGLVSTHRQGEKRYLTISCDGREMKEEVMLALKGAIENQIRVIREAFTALAIGKLQERFRVIDIMTYNRQRFVAAFGKQRDPVIFEQVLRTMGRRGYSIVGDRPLLRLLRAWTALPEARTLSLARLLKQEGYVGLDRPMNLARTDLAHAERLGFLTTTRKGGRVTLQLVDPEARIEEWEAKQEALRAYFTQLLKLELTPRLRETLELALRAVAERRADQTLHARLKELLTDRGRPEPLTARKASVYLNEFDDYLSRKLEISFKLTALEAIPAGELVPGVHPELFSGRYLLELERCFRRILEPCDDPRSEFTRLVALLERRLLASGSSDTGKPSEAADRPAETLTAKALWQRVAGLAQTHDLKVHELLLLKAVAGCWKGEPAPLDVVEEAYRQDCAHLNHPPSQRNTITKYASRLVQEGYLTKSVEPPRLRNTPVRRLSYLAPQEKARPPLIELEALLVDLFRVSPLGL